MTTAHSKLPPSSASRRMACPGSRAMCERYARNEESEASKEGTLAHKFAAEYLKNDCIDAHSDSRTPGMTDEMLEGARLYARTIQRFCINQKASALSIETRVDVSNVHLEMWGTPDAFLINFDENRKPKELHVFDYKYGFTPVDAFENWQLLAYACGIIKDLKGINGISLHIIQPRDYVSPSEHKMWELTAQELEDYRRRLQTSEALAMTHGAPLRVSSECKYCPARHACPALRGAAFGATELAYRDIPHGLNAREVGIELKLLHDALELLQYRITALESEAEHHLKSGANVDHYELARTTGRLCWTNTPKDVIALGMMFGINLSKEDTLTPTQAIKKGIPEETILQCSERKQSLKLSRTDVNKAKAVFSNH